MTSTQTSEDREKVEKYLIGLWEELLKKDGIGTRADFFELGGSSMQMIMALSAVMEKFKVQLDVEKFLDDPCIHALTLQVVE
jgi:acyl carrier protein